MVLFFLIIAILYILLLGGLVFGYQKIPLFFSQKNNPQTGFSVIVPFRNEATNLPRLLQTLKNLKYPADLFEIIFVNDNSEDTSVAIIETYITENQLISWKVINSQQQSQSPKKDAITTGISVSRFPWIVCTDADCEVPLLWLHTFDVFIQQNPAVLIAGPVQFVAVKKSLLHQLQIQESIILNSVTVGAFGCNQPFMCNGANLAYLISAFEEIGGFSGNNHISSGDDVFLLQKMKNQFPERVKYLKSSEAIVLTPTENSWKKVLSQRIRWAAKTPAYSAVFPKVLGIITLLMNLSVYISLLLLPDWRWFVVLFLSKIITDSFLLFPNARLFKTRIFLHTYLLNSLLYPLWMFMVFCGTFLIKTQWKGRDFVK